MAFQTSLFWLVDKRSVKTHIRIVVRIFRIWTGVPDVVYREKHMLTDSVQPYNKPIIDLACSICTVKYQTSVFCIQKNLGLIFHSTDLTLGQ